MRKKVGYDGKSNKSNTSRTKNFKIGCFHGKLTPENRSVEAILRNELFLVGMLKIQIARNESKDIRLVAYELPLQTGKSRGECIDLFGYDQNKVPWIIELKKSGSNERINKIVDQINRYEVLFSSIKKHIEVEIREKYHWNDFEFADGTEKMILAHRSFYKNDTPEGYKSLGIYCCSFSDIRANEEKEIFLLEKFGSKGFVRLKIENR